MTENDSFGIYLISSLTKKNYQREYLSSNAFCRLTLTCTLKESKLIMSELNDVRIRYVEEVFIMYTHIYNMLNQEFNERNRIHVSF